MVRKLGFSFILAVFLLGASNSHGSAMPPQMKSPISYPQQAGQPQGKTPSAVVPAPDIISFQVVLNPAQSGFTTDGTYSMVVTTFKSHLVAVVWDLVAGLRIVSSADGQNWQANGPFALGFDACYTSSQQMIEFRGKLYIPMDDSCNLPGLLVRSADGITVETVIQDTDHILFGANLPDKLGLFKSMLYMTTVGDNGQIWRSLTGDPGTWKLVNPSLGTGVVSTSPLVAFNGSLYFSDTDAVGVHVWRSADGKNWEMVGQGVVDDPENHLDGNMVVFNSNLYLSTTNQKGSPAIGRIYRSADGIYWNLVVDHGFGNPNPSGIEALIVYNNRIYAFSTDTVSHVVHVWASASGDPGSWRMTNPDGIGANTKTTRCMQAVFNGELYIANDMGLGTDIDLFKMVRH